MCGIYGMFSLTGEALRHPEVLEAMRQSVHHRGPDGGGLISTREAALGVERLRIVDPRDRADQPFTSPDGHVWLAGNGEIYNHQSLREAYGRYPFQSVSDIETALPTLLESRESLARLEGKYAIVAWHQTKAELTLMRDRAGENPLFYAILGDEVVVASEIQAVLLHPSVDRALDEEAVSQFFTHGYVLEPRTMFAAIKRIEAGTICTISRSGSDSYRYWNPAEQLEADSATPAPTARSLDRLLTEAVGRQLSPGVSTGVFCSGGLDSSLLAALTRLHRGPGVPTFTIKFAARDYDESSHAADLARHLETEHTEVVADDDSLQQAFRETARFAEPMSDPAVLPTLLLARNASGGLKVVMSGEGADELFGGYPTYLGHKLADTYNQSPGWIRHSLARLVNRLPASHGRVPVEFLLKRFVGAAELPWIERHAAWFSPGSSGLLSRPRSTIGEYGSAVAHHDASAGPMRLDYLTYLRDQLLVKFDRTTMSYALEARCPYLDRTVTEFAMALPAHMKIRGLTTKWLLKETARRHLPSRFITRRKQGLSVPVAALINGALRHEVDRLLVTPQLTAHGLLRVGILEKMLAEHRSGFANHARALWVAITFQHWYERWVLESRNELR